MYLRLPSRCLTIFLAFPFPLSPAPEAEKLTPKKNQQNRKIAPQDTAKAAKAQAEREEKEKAAREQALAEKKVADDNLRRQRDNDETQIKINQQIATFNKWLVVVGFLQVLVALLTWFVTNKAANAAQLAADVARDTLIDRYRARIGIVDADFGETDSTNDPSVRYRLHNDGPIAANGIVVIEIMRHGIGSGFRWPDRRQHFSHAGKEEFGTVIDPDFDEHFSRLLIKPDGPRPPLFTETQWENMVAGIIQVQVGIIAAYWDGRGNERITENWYEFNSTNHLWRTVLVRQE